MDLIEVLWKQDVDLGFTLVEPTATAKKASTSEKGTEDDIEKLKALEAINANNEKVCETLCTSLIVVPTFPLNDQSSAGMWIVKSFRYQRRFLSRTGHN